jgi:hypothetical protein
MASLRRRDGADPAAPTTDVTFLLKWVRSGGLYRVESLKLLAGTPEKPSWNTYTFSCSTIQGIDLLTSFTVTSTGAGGVVTTVTVRVEDLVVNGTKAETPVR